MQLDTTSTSRLEPNDVRLGVVESLRQDGIAVLPFQDLFDEDLWRAALEDAEPFVAIAAARTRDVGDAPANKHELILRRFHVPKGKREPPTLSLDSPLLRIGASDTLLDVVNSYRGLDTRLIHANYWYTVPYRGAPERIASQQWHRDPEDAHVVKVFLYLSDVNENAGPFEYVRDSKPGARYGDFWPWGGNERPSRYPPPEELARRVDPDDFLTLTGPAGTFIFCDTSGFHRGGFARTKARVLATWTYVSTSARKSNRHFLVDFADRAGELSPQVRAALD
jgi:hypothetical protein